ncbi:cytochrome oxidase putative small subunit CydP [Rhodoferax sp.]|uniref:cytochrome oxidase putative small subunit CydP n=1 Tax=Rhodoferax sp. TaxID=50421 RepID=UPI00271D2AE9|nr:cytochrome oxidase putative small subunit CydP [Rhodoferax sp.]MDO8321227.1 hypothetical protein [Rhodoferax sp.]
MNPADQRLVKRLAWVLAIKLVLLYGLWWGFVRDQRVTVDAAGMAAQALVPGFETVKGENK